MKQPSRIIYGGRGKGKMMSAEEFIKLLPKDIQEKTIVVRAFDKPPKLKGARLPRMIEITERNYIIAEALRDLYGNERQD